MRTERAHAMERSQNRAEPRHQQILEMVRCEFLNFVDYLGLEPR